MYHRFEMSFLYLLEAWLCLVDLLYKGATLLSGIQSLKGTIDAFQHAGHQCLQNPADPTLFPGRVKCHEVMEYCTTHIRYLVNNQSLGTENL